MNQHPSLTCPKCAGTMTSYERAGILVDQCRDCRGIFLDRGELERLLDHEGAAAPAAAPQTPMAAAAPRQSSRADWDDDSDSHRRHPSHGGSSSSHGHKRKKKSSLLSELFDFG